MFVTYSFTHLIFELKLCQDFEFVNSFNSKRVPVKLCYNLCATSIILYLLCVEYVFITFIVMSVYKFFIVKFVVIIVFLLKRVNKIQIGN